MLKIRLGFPPFLVRAGSESCPFQKFSRYLRMVRSVKAPSLPSGRGLQPFILNLSFIMAKGNMLLGFSRGSVGDLTFYRRNAQQITRARARVVKNPKTLAQQMQRAIMRTSVEAYKVLKEICDHSWEGIAYGANSYAEFQKQNMAMLRRLAAEGGENTKSFIPSGFNGLVSMPWVLSKGTISWVGIKDFSANEGVYIYFNGFFAEAQAIDTITYKAVADALGLRQGDQITLIAAEKRSDIDESSASEIHIARLILSPAQGEFAETNVFDTNGRVNDPNPLNENTDYFRFDLVTSENRRSLRASRADDPDVATIGVAVIISRRAADGSWLRSPATFYFNQQQQEGGYTLRQASMVVAPDITVSSDWYLNNANEGSGE